MFKWGKLFCPPRITVRHSSKPNISKPRVPHFHRLLVLETTKPVFAPDPTPAAYQCDLLNDSDIERTKLSMYEKHIGLRLLKYLDEHSLVAIYHANSVDKRTEFEVVKLLFRNNMFLKMFNKFILELTLKDTKYESLLPLFCSHTKFVFSKEPRVDKLLKLQKKMPEFVLLAAILEDRILSKKDIDWYCALPSLDLLRGQLCLTVSAMAMKTVEHLGHHQRELCQSLATLADPPKEDSVKEPENG